MTEALSVLRYRDFTVYAVARFCSTLAWEMLGVAVGWQVYQLTRNPLDLGFVGLAQFLPFVILVLPAGYVADHADRRMVLVSAYGTQGICAGLLLWFTLSGATQVWPVFVAMTLFGAARAFSMPASQAIAQTAAGQSQLGAATSTVSLARAIGSSAGTFLFGSLVFVLLPAPDIDRQTLGAAESAYVLAACHTAFLATAVVAALGALSAGRLPAINLRKEAVG